MIKVKELNRTLDASEIEFRVSEVRASEKGVFASILAYKDARCDMKRLDEVCGAYWQVQYRRDTQGVLQCGIGIKVDDEWIWRWSNGTPSNFEAQKGEYSDAFKRAGFMWGIGRELYDYPPMFVKLVKGEFYIKGENKWGKPDAKATKLLKPQNWDWQVTITDEGIEVVGSQNGKQRIKAKK